MNWILIIMWIAQVRQIDWINCFACDENYHQRALIEGSNGLNKIFTIR